jgi:ADP-ribose pyrophosphatase YjhB (NUDIX family)
MKNINYCYKCGSELGKRTDEGRQRYYCDQCSEFRYRNAVPVGGVFVVKDNEVLLIKRGGEPNKGKWSYPAGYLEFDEKPEVGAARELEEETGLKADVEDLELVATIQLEHPDKYVVGNAYATSVDSTEGEVSAGTDAENARFWKIEQMEQNLDQMESAKIVEAAEEAVNLIKTRSRIQS